MRGSYFYLDRLSNGVILVKWEVRPGELQTKHHSSSGEFSAACSKIFLKKVEMPKGFD
jgi:hypothetical protein